MFGTTPLIFSITGFVIGIIVFSFPAVVRAILNRRRKNVLGEIPVLPPKSQVFYARTEEGPITVSLPDPISSNVCIDIRKTGKEPVTIVAPNGTKISSFQGDTHNVGFTLVAVRWYCQACEKEGLRWIRNGCNMDLEVAREHHAKSPCCHSLNHTRCIISAFPSEESTQEQ